MFHEFPLEEIYAQERSHEVHRAVDSLPQSAAPYSGDEATVPQVSETVLREGQTSLSSVRAVH
jgi:hypothetical protein